MKVPAFVKALDTVDDEELRSQYRPVDGGFVFVPEGLDSDDVRPHYDKLVAPQIASALEKERTERKRRGEELEGWRKLGVEPSEAEKILAKHRAAIEKGAETNDPEMVKEMKEIHRKEKKAWEMRESEYKEELERLTVDQEIMDAITAEGGNPKMLRPFLKLYVKRVEDNGARVVRVLKDDGKSIRVGDAEGTPMTVRGFVASLKQEADWKPAFSVTVPEGAGTPRSKSSGEPIVGSVKSIKDFKNLPEKLAWIAKNGRAAFEALPLE